MQKNILNSVKSFVINNWLGLTVIAISILIQIAFLTRSFDFLLTSVIPDDAFYYFQIARNIVSGYGSTFDGIHPTNGYHPLWLLILLPIFKIFSVGGTFDMQPVYAALSVEILFNAVSGIVMLLILSRYTAKQWLKAFALGLWFFNPFLIYETMNGLETGLSLMLISIFFLLALKIQARENIYRNTIIAAVIGGLMVLARIDNIFFVLMFYVWLWAQDLTKENFKKVFKIGLISVVIILPLFIYNLVYFKMLLTSASSSNTIVTRQLIVQDHGPSIAQKVKASIYSTHYQVVDLITHTGVPAGTYILIGLGLGWWMMRKGMNVNKKIAGYKIEYFLFAGFLLNFLANSAIRWVGRPWYFVSFTVFLMIFVTWLFEQFYDSVKFKKTFIGALVAFTLFSFYVNWSKNLKSQYALQSQMYEASLWMNKNFPEERIVGAFNAGILGYFSENRVINLDGLVNNSAAEAIRNKKVWSYIKQQKIDYIADSDIYLYYRYKSFLDHPNLAGSLVLAKKITAPGANPERALNIYRVR